MSKVLVSFIIPTLNEGQLLGNCLGNIKAQEFPQEKIYKPIPWKKRISDFFGFGKVSGHEI